MVKGKLRIVSLNYYKEVSNLVISRNISVLFETIQGKYTPYIAFGKDDTQPTQNDFILGAEVARNPAQIEIGLNQVTFRSIFSGAELNTAEAKEFGIFSGATASPIPNTGSLIARTVYEDVYPDYPVIIYWEISIEGE